MINIKQIRNAALAALVLLTTGCSEWFDLSPKTDVKADELFESESGFESALTGIYVLMTDQSLYGAAFQYDFVERLAQRYDKYTQTMPTDDDRALIYDYVKTSASKSSMTHIWSVGYKVIANANNLIGWLDKKGDRVIRDPNNRARIRGEALAIRAYVHLDLLRAWGPIYSENPDQRSIPYRNIASTDKMPLLKASEVIDLVIADLLEAEKVLSFEQDALLNQGGLPVNDRRFHFNIHAVRGVLARAYLYKGDRTNAFRYAELVVKNSGLELCGDNREQNSMMFSESLVALSYYKMTEKITSYFQDVGDNFDNQLWISNQLRNDVFEGFTVGANDVRYKADYGFFVSSLAQKCMLRKYLGESTNGKVPLVRLSEMYYIMCESAPIDQAPQYLNKVRNSRGISSTYNYSVFTDEAQRTEALSTEYQKDFFGEAQWWWFLKRNGATTFYRCPIANGMTALQYVFPLPDDEVEFGWTAEE